MVELTTYIKGIGAMMQTSDTVIADALWEAIHAEVIKGTPGQYYKYHDHWRNQTHTVVFLIVYLHWLETGNFLSYVDTPKPMLRLVPALKETSFCHPRVHSVWQVLVDILFGDLPVVNEDATTSHSTQKTKKSKKP